MKKIILLLCVLLTTYVFSQSQDSDCEIQDENNIIVFEAERFELKGAWRLGIDEKASGGKYIYYNGPNSYQKVNSSNNISYTFKVTNPGAYTFKWMMRQPEGERGSDLGNDAWFYFEGDIAKGLEGKLDTFYKFVGRSGDDFILNGVAEVNHKATWVTVVFPSAGEYTLNLSGRSHHFELDRLILYKNKESLDQVDLEIRGFAETTTCDDQIVAELVELVGLEPVYANKQLKIPFKLNYITSGDRELLVSVRDIESNIIKTEKRIVGIGTKILTYDFVLDNELVVGGNYEFYAELRSVGGDETQTLTDVTKVFNVFEGEAPPESDEISYVNPPTKIASSTDDIVVRVSYSATKNRNIVMALSNPGGGFVKNVTQLIPLGAGEVDVKLDLSDKNLWNAKGFKLALMLRPVGGNFNSNLDFEAIFFDMVPQSQLSVAALNKANIGVLENPFRQTFSFTNNGKIKNVRIYNLKAQELLKHKAASGINSVLTQSLVSGVYFVEFEFIDSSRTAIKVVKK